MRRNGRIWTLSERDAHYTAAQKLRAAVQTLTRAKRLQILVEYIWGGLFWSLAVACAAVLLIRFGQLPYTISTVVAGLVCLGLLAAVLIAWQRRPDPLQVAILADLQLNLKQKLSTAWEFARPETNPALTECLAAQAIRARLPARPERVFPLRINIWGRLSPVAVVLLMLLGTVELHRMPQPSTTVVDELVVGQGVQLREYARRMETRAQRENLTRSSAQAQAMQRLGNRMASGALSRGQALSRLRQLGAAVDAQRRSALNGGLANEIGTASLALRSVPGAMGLRTFLEDLAAGRARADGLRFSAADEQALSQLGIAAEELEQALAALAAGDHQALRQLIKRFSKIDQALLDAEELDKAQQKLQRVRENLGDTDSSDTDGRNEAASISAGSGFSDFGDHSAGEFLPQDNASDPGRGSGYNPQGTSQQPSSFTPPTESLDLILKPASRPGEGEVFVSAARVLPRSGQPALTTMELDARFSAQVEEALSKEDYPLHQKELIRRYFLTLSEGVPAEDATAGQP